jgi:hypothetical protein
VAAQLGYCGLDAQRRPLRGDEIRGCWEASATTIETPTPDHEQAATHRALPPLNVVEDRTPVRRLEFVEVQTAPAKARRRAAAAVGSRDQDGLSADGHSGEGRVGAHVAGWVAVESGTGSIDDGAPVAEARTADDAAGSVFAGGPTEPRWSLWGDAEL